MDGFSYINIFDTKGIEYIVVIIFLLLLIPFFIILNKNKEIRTALNMIRKQLSDKIRNIPNGLFYSQNHTWTFLEKSGIAKIGLDDLLLHVTGIVSINFVKGPDDMIRKGEMIAEIDHNGHILKVYSPVSGKLTGLNPLLNENPGIINDDPYHKGWLISIKPSDWKAETSACYLAEEAQNWLLKESDRVKDFLAVKSAEYAPGPVPVLLQDGGELCENVLQDMPGDLWNEFQTEFLDPV